jgi:cell wall assembly regulator SMI1
MRTVEESWTSIIDWLNRNAPRADAIRGPADPVALCGAEEAVQEALPDDLRAWWLIADGFGTHRGTVTLLPALYMPMPQATALDERATWMSILESDPDRSPPNDPEAGTVTYNFSPKFLRIAEGGGGSSLFVDLRPGLLHGCVMEWVIGQEFTPRPLWSSTRAMLHDVSEALTTGAPCLQEHAELMAEVSFPASPLHASVPADEMLRWSDSPRAQN